MPPLEGTSVASVGVVVSVNQARFTTGERMSIIFYNGTQIDSTATQDELAALISERLESMTVPGRNRPIFVPIPVTSGVQMILVTQASSIILRADVKPATGQARAKGVPAAETPTSRLGF